MMDNEKVGLFIKEKLKEKGITQEKLAELLNISGSAVSQALSGKNLFDISNLNEISQILDIPLDMIINGGNERETNLERLAKKSHIEIIKENPSLSCLNEIDSKNNHLSGYLLKHKNMEVIEKLPPYYLVKEYKDKVEFLTLIIEKNKLDLLKELQKFGMDNLISTVENSFLSYSHQNIEFDKLDRLNQEFVKAYMTNFSENLAITINLFRTSNIYSHELPALVKYAFIFDNVIIIEYYEQIISNDDRKKYYDSYNNINNMFINAIKAKSKNILNHYYKLSYDVSFAKYFEVLIETKDVEFINNFRNDFPDKAGGHKSYNNNPLIFDNSRSLIQIIKDNNLDLLQYAIQFSNQKSLDLALRNTEGHQIDIIKLLINRGAMFSMKDSHSGNEYSFESMTAIIKYLLNKK